MVRPARLWLILSVGAVDLARASSPVAAKERLMGTPLAVYLPQDRRQALARGEDLPEQTSGATLFADISGFTPLTEALDRALGARRGVEEVTRQINRVYDALIDEVERYGGSVIGFAGDAMTWRMFLDNVPYHREILAAWAEKRRTE